MTGLTDRQRDVLGFMLTFCAENKRPPGIREIGEGIGVTSMNSVFEHLRRLSRKGFVVAPGAGKPNACWPTRDLGGAPIRWRLTYERTDA